MSFTCEHCGSTVSCLSQVGRGFPPSVIASAQLLAEKDRALADLQEQGRIMVAAADRHFATATRNHHECVRLKDEIADLQARVEAAEKDAARYRWLRGEGVIFDEHKEGDGARIRIGIGVDRVCDAALTTARTKERDK